jgi:methylaspartate ammonia-lyase
MKRTAAAGITVVAALLVAGCSSDKPVDTGLSDDQLIRAALIKENAATAASNFDAVAEMTCEKYRDRARSQGDRLLPPMNTFDEIEPAVLGPDLLGTILKDKIAGSTIEMTAPVAQALVSRDQAAYSQAMKGLIQQASSIKIVTIENIHVDGDTAAADATFTSALAGDQPTVDARSIQLVREGGQWKDCTPPTDG